LDGSVAGDVSAQHRADAVAALSGTPKIKQEKTIISATIQAKSIKATVVLEASDIARLEVPNGVSRVVLRVQVAGRALSADLNAESVRKCIAAIEAAGPVGANVILQGKLEGDDKPLDAGLVAQPKTPRPVEQSVAA
jgi:hypothetical protein